MLTEVTYKQDTRIEKMPKSNSHYETIYNKGIGIIFYGRPSSLVCNMDRFALALSVVAIALSGAALILTGLVWFQTIKDIIPPDSQGAFACVDCRTLVRNGRQVEPVSDLDTQLSVFRQAGAANCCAFNSQQMVNLIDLILSKEESAAVVQKVNPDPTNFTHKPVSAHKKLYPSDKESTMMINRTVPFFDNDSLVTAYFREENEVSEHLRGVNVNRWGLRVLHTGWYLVYSSVFFQPKSRKPCKEFRYKIWGQYVQKVVINYPDKNAYLLKALHTCCDECTDQKDTSYTSGVFHLNQGDVIRVQVSGYGLVEFTPESSFAGLVLLNSGPDNSSSQSNILTSVQ